MSYHGLVYEVCQQCQERRVRGEAQTTVENGCCNAEKKRSATESVARKGKRWRVLFHSRPKGTLLYQFQTHQPVITKPPRLDVPRTGNMYSVYFCVYISWDVIDLIFTLTLPTKRGGNRVTCHVVNEYPPVVQGYNVFCMYQRENLGDGHVCILYLCKRVDVRPEMRSGAVRSPLVRALSRQCELLRVMGNRSCRYIASSPVILPAHDGFEE